MANHLLYDLAHLYGPIIVALLITVSVGIFIIKKGRISKAWAFATPIAVFFIYLLSGYARSDTQSLEGLLFFFEGVGITCVVLVLNAIILGIYLWRRKS
jgi:hypothetical protein